MSGPRTRSPRTSAYYYLERKYPAFGNLTRATWPRATPASRVESGRGVGPLGVNQQLVQIGGVVVVGGSVKKLCHACGDAVTRTASCRAC